MKESSSFHTQPLQNLTTEGWLELYLTLPEKRSFSQWKEKIQNRSLTHHLSSTLVELISTKIPDTVAPNLITLAGFLCLGQAWYVTSKYGEAYPTACTWFAVLNVLIYFFTHSVDLRHAERTRQTSALGYLWNGFSRHCNDLLSRRDDVFDSVVYHSNRPTGVVYETFAVQCSYRSW